MNLLKKVSLGLCSTLLASSAFAGEFLVLDFGDKLMRAGQGEDTLALRQAIKQQHPGIQLRNKELLSVVLVGKSKHGHGTAELVVGQAQSDSQLVDGQPNKFRSNVDKTYDRLLFENPKNNSNGKWQIHLTGQQKIKQVVVEISDESQSMEKIELSYNGQHFRGQNTIGLKRALANQIGLDPQDFNLYAVEVTSKSALGRGQVSLIVGQDQTPTKTIDGRPGQFNNNALHTYSKQLLMNPSANSNGRWQLDLKGNIKIQNVKLYMQYK